MTENAKLTKEELLQKLEDSEELNESLYKELRRAWNHTEACLEIIKHLQNRA